METRKLSSQDIFDGIALLCKMCTPATVDESVVKSALASGFTEAPRFVILGKYIIANSDL
ncbi:MAG: hypothetical protein E7107_14800 [Prevotella sp.]|nr:hypothetical protein [Prevotella sp.]